jgi:hypothetical protein
VRKSQHVVARCAAIVAVGILMLVGCLTAGGDGEPGISEYYDGLAYQAEHHATAVARNELSDRAWDDEMNYRATEDWHRSYGQATEEAY